MKQTLPCRDSCQRKLSLIDSCFHPDVYLRHIARNAA